MKIVKRKINNLEVYYMHYKKFKTIDISFIYSNEAIPEEVNERVFLSEILTDTSKKYNNHEKLNLATNDLYGLSHVCQYNNIGNIGLMMFFIKVVGDKYLGDENNLSKSLDFLLELIYNPKLYKGKIPKKTVDELIEQNEELLLSIKQNKNVYSYVEFMKNYINNNPHLNLSFPVTEYFSSISQDSVTKVYNKLINEDNLKIFIAGDFDFDKMDEMIENKLAFIDKRDNSPIDLNYVFNPTKQVKEVVEETSTGQTRVFLGYDLGFESNKKNAMIMAIFDELFGGYEKSMLFSSIREKLNLSYYVYSKYSQSNHLFYIVLETDKENYNKALNEVKRQLELCKNGEISEVLFNQAKENLIKKLEILVDSQTRFMMNNIIEFIQFNQAFDLTKSIKDFQKISLKDVTDLIKNINLDTVYIYTNGDK